MQPASGNLEYATLVSPLPVPTPNWANQSLSPELSAACNVALRYLVPETAYDLQLTWTHLDASESASVTAAPDQFVGPSFEIGPDASLFSIATGAVDFEYDAVNIDGGLFLSDGGTARVRIFAGLQYARIGEELSATFQSEDGLLSNANVTDSLFNGVGPRLGLRAECLQDNFCFVGEFGASALSGKMQSRIDFAATSPALAGLGITPPNVQALTSPEATQVIPGIDSKLGVGYTFCGHECGRFRIEAGYQAAVYVDAVSQYALSEVVTPPVDQSVGVYLRTAERVQSNFTVHGPDLTASWVSRPGYYREGGSERSHGERRAKI